MESGIGPRRDAIESRTVSDAAPPPGSALLGVQDALLLLRSRSLQLGLLRRIAATPEWVRNDRVRAALVLHPRTPRPIAVGLLPHLRWGDLHRVTTTPGLPAPVVLLAERLLTERLPDLALGERISLARAASGAVVVSLRRDPSPLVLRALLENPRFRADDALFVAERAQSPAASLQLLAECPRWRGRTDLRRAIAAHPSSPAHVALGLVAAMDGAEIGHLLRTGGVPALVRLAAERRLAGPA